MRNIIIIDSTDRALGENTNRFNFVVIFFLALGFIVNLLVANSLKKLFKNINKI